MTATVPDLLAERTRAQRLRFPVGLGVGVALVTVGLRLRDPHQGGSWGFCPFNLLTGFDCPGCGGLRAVSDLTRGQIDAAFHSHAFLVLALPLVVGLWAWWVAAVATDRPVPARYRWLRLSVTGATVVLFVFTIWRNTPMGSAFYA